MDEDFKLSKDYISSFRRAKEIKNIEQMDELFRGLCSEIGVSDPQSDAAQAAAGKAAAELLNARDKGTGGKKI